MKRASILIALSFCMLTFVACGKGSCGGGSGGVDAGGPGGGGPANMEDNGPPEEPEEKGNHAAPSQKSDLGVDENATAPARPEAQQPADPSNVARPIENDPNQFNSESDPAALEMQLVDPNKKPEAATDAVKPAAGAASASAAGAKPSETAAPRAPAAPPVEGSALDSF